MERGGVGLDRLKREEQPSSARPHTFHTVRNEILKFEFPLVVTQFKSSFLTFPNPHTQPLPSPNPYNQRETQIPTTMRSGQADDDIDERMDTDGEEEGMDGEQSEKKGGKVYIPGVSRALKAGEEWDFDPEAYRIFHSYETG